MRTPGHQARALARALWEGGYDEAKGIDVLAELIQKHFPAYAEIRSSLQSVAFHFGQHLIDHAHEKSCQPPELCPCWDQLRDTRERVNKALDAEAGQEPLI